MDLAVHMSTYGSRTDEYESWGGIRVSEQSGAVGAGSAGSVWMARHGRSAVFRAMRGRTWGHSGVNQGQTGSAEPAGTKQSADLRFRWSALL